MNRARSDLRGRAIYLEFERDTFPALSTFGPTEFLEIQIKRDIKSISFSTTHNKFLLRELSEQISQNLF